MKSILALTCLCFVDVSRVYATSQRVLDFTSYFNGDFDNRAQTDSVQDDHEYLQARFIPVDINCSLPGPVVFFEEVVNNVIQEFILAVITDGIENTVSLAIYHFLDYTKYKPGEFNVESLSNISCKDFLGPPGCNASYTVSSEGFAYGNYQYCKQKVNGGYPRFTCLHFCDSITTTLPMYSPQKSPMEPYELLRRGNKYPLINPPTGYVAPCGN